ncbi:MAG: GFA family protein [Gammaproteobacteria bacterium]
MKADLSEVFVCHCSTCRRSSGSNGMAVVDIANDQFRWLRGQHLITSWKKPGADWQK